MWMLTLLLLLPRLLTRVPDKTSSRLQDTVNIATQTSAEPSYPLQSGFGTRSAWNGKYPAAPTGKPVQPLPRQDDVMPLSLGTHLGIWTAPRIHNMKFGFSKGWDPICVVSQAPIADSVVAQVGWMLGWPQRRRMRSNGMTPLWGLSVGVILLVPAAGASTATL